MREVERVEGDGSEDRNDADFGALLAASVRLVKSCGVNGQDAEAVALDLLTRRYVLGGAGSLTRPSKREVEWRVRDFRRREGRCRMRERAAAQREAQFPEHAGPEAVRVLSAVRRVGRRAVVRALRRLRKKIHPDELRAFAYSRLGDSVRNIALRLGSSPATWSRRLITVRAKFEQELSAHAACDAFVQDFVGFDRLLRRVARAWTRQTP